MLIKRNQLLFFIYLNQVLINKHKKMNQSFIRQVKIFRVTSSFLLVSTTKQVQYETKQIKT